MIQRLTPLIFLASCSLMLEPPPAATSPSHDAGSSAGDAATPPPDGGVTSDGGQSANDAGARPQPCDDGFRRDQASGTCVPQRGEGALCQTPQELAANHRWAQGATLRYVAPEGAGNGLTPQSPAGLNGTVERQGDEALAVILTPGDYTLSAPLQIGARGPIMLLGTCASEVRITHEDGAILEGTQGAQLSLFGLALHAGPPTRQEGITIHAIRLEGAAQVRMEQLRITAANGHGITMNQSDDVQLRGVTFDALQGHAIHGTDPLGSWTIECNLLRGPIGGDGIAMSGGSGEVTINDNSFFNVAGNGISGTSPLGSWTIECNLLRGPIGGDGISLARSGPQSTMRIADNEIEEVQGHGISSQDAFGSWTIECNLLRGPMGGGAMHLHGQGGTATVHNNQITGAQSGILLTDGDAQWTVTGNRVEGSNEAGPSPGMGLTGLRAGGSVTLQDNTISYAHGTALDVQRSAAALVATGNTFSNSIDARGGAAVLGGVGVTLIDSTGINLGGDEGASTNTIQNNAQAGVLVDLARWGQVAQRPDLTGNVVIALRDDGQLDRNGAAGEGADLIIQNTQDPQEIQQTLPSETNVETPTPEEAVPVARATPPPPRCGDGNTDAPSETCDDGNTDDQDACSNTCQTQQGFRRVVAGARHFCAISYWHDWGEQGGGGSNAVLNCAGNNAEFALGWAGGNPPASRANFGTIADVNLSLRDIAANRNGNCALLSDGGVRCWGQGRALEPTVLAVPVDTRLKSLVGAAQHWCALSEGNTVLCAGQNLHYAMGTGRTSEVQLRELTVNNEPLVVDALWTGPKNTCVTRSGNLVCWGANDHGQLATGDFIERRTPSDEFVPNLEGVVDVAIGADHLCAITQNGLLYCWGAGGGYRLGTGNTSDQATPTRITLPEAVVQVDTSRMGDDHDPPLTCAVGVSGAVYCFGINPYDVARHQRIALPIPTRIQDVASVRSIALSEGYACAISTTGTLHCWGADGFRNPVHGRHQEAALAAGQDNLAMDPIDRWSMGLTHGILLAKDSNANPGTLARRAFVWGRNDSGQLGLDADTTAHVTALTEIGVNGDTNVFDRVTAADDAVCMHHEGNKTIHCAGKLGAFEPNINTPIQGYTSGAPYPDLMCGGRHCCAVAPERTRMYCWGDNTYGQTGGPTPTTSTAYSITIPPGFTRFGGMALGTNHSCVVVEKDIMGPPPTQDRVHCWGRNNHGQMGNSLPNDGIAPGSAVRDTNGALAANSLIGGPDTLCARDETVSMDAFSGFSCWGRRLPFSWGSSTMAMQESFPGSYGRETLAIQGNTTCWIQAHNNNTYSVVCAGENTFGRIQPGNPPDDFFAVNAGGGPGLNSDFPSASVRLGLSTACAVIRLRNQAHAKLQCWGDARGGRAGGPLRAITTESLLYP